MVVRWWRRTTTPLRRRSQPQSRCPIDDESRPHGGIPSDGRATRKCAGVGAPFTSPVILTCRLGWVCAVPHDFNARVIDQAAHRPWAMPRSPWLMTQTWHNVLFAHWPIDPAALQAKVPHEFPIDLFKGQAWISIVPFHMTNVAPRGFPALPWLSAFPELNVRTYVRVGNRPGVYFLSLDAGRTLAVYAARALLNLPYHWASMHVHTSADGVEYHSRRPQPSPGTLAVRYAPTGPPFAALEGSLDYFLTERYCLYNVNHRAGPYQLDTLHPPWRLQRADAEFMRNTMAEIHGLLLPARPALLHFASRQDMVAWAPVRIDDWRPLHPPVTRLTS
jgi:uncharacterized protein YqjF (DUF2071 family)